MSKNPTYQEMINSLGEVVYALAHLPEEHRIRVVNAALVICKEQRIKVIKDTNHDN